MTKEQFLKAKDLERRIEHVGKIINLLSNPNHEYWALHFTETISTADGTTFGHPKVDLENLDVGILLDAFRAELRDLKGKFERL